MLFPFRSAFWFGVICAVALAPASSAQIALTINATNSLTTSYNAGDPSEGINPSLRVSSQSVAPSSVSYSGATGGTFTVDFQAPAGSQFTVTPYDGSAQFRFQVAYTNYNSGRASGGLTGSGAVSVSFVGLQGTAPTLSSSYTLGDIPHAYMAVSTNANVTQAFSFTGLRFTFNYTGTGANLSVPYFEGGNISVTDSTYFGPSSPASGTLLQVSAIPEPSTYATIAGAAMLGLALWRRRSARPAAAR